MRPLALPLRKVRYRTELEAHEGVERGEAGRLYNPLGKAERRRNEDGSDYR